MSGLMRNPWLISLAIGSVAVLAALVGHWIVFRIVARLAKWGGGFQNFNRALLDCVKGPTRVIMPLAALCASVPAMTLPDEVRPYAQHAAGVIGICNLGWLAIVAVQLFERVVTARHSITVRDNLRARRIQTQVKLLRRIAAGLIVIITLGLALMTFPEIRTLGVSLFASAGLAGIVVGLAARPTFANMIAGLQVALTEPIRLDDVVIVEGEYGWIEEINTTYVVVKLWDLRRIVLPLTYFIEKPFQNWTRTSSDIMGTAFVYADYTVPVSEARAELERILKANKLWDGKVVALHVTAVKEQSVELRALMSAQDSGSLFDLQCHVREKMVEWLRERHPESLPRIRRLDAKPNGIKADETGEDGGTVAHD
jgi:small-conductance mechanosensitive channel